MESQTKANQLRIILDETSFTEVSENAVDLHIQKLAVGNFQLIFTDSVTGTAKEILIEDKGQMTREGRLYRLLQFGIPVNEERV